MRRRRHSRSEATARSGASDAAGSLIAAPRPACAAGRRVEHGERFVPSILGPEQVLHGLAHGAVPAGCGGHEGRRSADLGGRIMDGYRVSACTHGRKIGKVVTDEGHRGERDTACIRGRLQILQLVMAPGIEVPDPQFLEPMPYRQAGTPGDDGNFAAQPAPERDPQAILRVESLRLVTEVVQLDSAVREDTVDIQAEQADRCRPRGHFEEPCSALRRLCRRLFWRDAVFLCIVDVDETLSRTAAVLLNSASATFTFLSWTAVRKALT